MPIAIYKAAELARQERCTLECIYKRLWAGKLDGVKIDRVWRILVGDEDSKIAWAVETQQGLQQEIVNAELHNAPQFVMVRLLKDKMSADRLSMRLRSQAQERNHVGCETKTTSV